MRSSKDSPIRLYAHWLDGEWLKIAYPVLVEGPYHTLHGIAEGALKLHALFGTRIAISDVQLTDSGVMVRLFANPEFRDYLRHDRGFLTLVAEPPKDRKGIDNQRLATAPRGLSRAFETAGWTTSLSGMKVDVIKEFGETILSLDDLDTAHCARDRSKGPGRIIAKYPQHAEMLDGILRAICYFVMKTGGPIESPAKTPRRYTEFIEDALESRGVRSEDEGALEEIWKTIQDWVKDSEAPGARSSVLKAIEAKEPDRSKWTLEWHRLWNTVVHAWNNNVCDTVGAKRASIAPLPHAVVTYRGEISDVAGPFKRKGWILQPTNTRKYPVLTFDPSSLGWDSVRDAICKTRGQRAEFQMALQIGDKREIEEAGAGLVRGLATVVVPKSRSHSRDWIWLSIATLGLFSGSPILEGIAITGEAHSLLKPEVRKWLVLNTLHGFQNDLISAFRGR